MNRVVKQEYVEEDPWKGPARGPIPAIPGVNRSRRMTMVEYHRIVKNPKNLPPVKLEDITLRRVVWKEIEMLPKLWKSKSQSERVNLYPKIAVRVYKRTGVILLCSEVIKIFRWLRCNLRDKLKSAIVCKKLLNIEDLENHMWTWEFYPFARFLRDGTHKWELELRRRLRVDPDGNPLSFEVDDEDLYEELNENAAITNPQLEITNAPTPVRFEEVSAANSSSQSRRSTTDHGIRRSCHCQVTSTPQNPEGRIDGSAYECSFSAVPSHEDPNQMEQSPHSSRRSRVELQNDEDNQIELRNDQQAQRAQLMEDFTTDLNQIAHQAMRNLRNDPLRYNELRGALFDFVLDFGRYQNVGELFAELARKYRTE